MTAKKKKIGVLALQGAFREHVKMLNEVGAEGIEVRLPAQLEGLDGLIIPGGESTTIGKLMVTYKLQEPLREQIKAGLPTWGTCAGMILLANDIGGLDQPLLGVLDVKVKRNGFGRQLDSFESALKIPVLGAEPFPAVFIRAPYIEQIGPAVEILGKLADERGTVIACQQGKILATSFHPELGADTRFHRYFLSLT